MNAARSITGIALLVFLMAAACAPLTPLVDPDEGYYPATAAETLRSGSFWDLRFNDAPRWDKPLLSYAVIEGAFEIFGEHASAARLPSAIEAAALIAIVGFILARIVGSRAGVLCALVVGTTLGVSIFSRVAHPELAVVLSVVSTELLLCLWLSSPDGRTRRRTAVAAGVAIGVGLLAKGPVAAVLPLLALLCALPFLRPSFDTLKALSAAMLLSAGVAAVIALPWYIAMTVRHGAAFIFDAVWWQNVGRYTTATYGHRTAALSLWLSAILGVLPWAALLPQACAAVRRPRSSARDTLRTFTCASAVSTLAFYSFSTSKLAAYSLVCVPLLAIMIGLWLDDVLDTPTSIRQGWRQTIMVLAAVGAVLFSAPWWLGRLVTTRQLLGSVRPDSSDAGALLAPIVMPLGILMAAGALGVFVLKGSRGRIATLAGVGLLAPLLVIITARPILKTMYPWEAIGDVIRSAHGHVYLLGRRAPSLTFYARQAVTMAPDEATFLADIRGEREGWLAVSRNEWTHLAAGDAMRAFTTAVVATQGSVVLVRFTNPSRRSVG